MARTSRKTQAPPTPPANVTDIDDAFSRVMARACQAAADKIQDDALNQLSVGWERGNQTQFHETQRASRDDFGLVGEVHLKPIPEGRWKVFYNRATATYRLEEIEAKPVAEIMPTPAPKPDLKPVAKPRQPAAPKPTTKPEPKPVAKSASATKPQPKLVAAQEPEAKPKTALASKPAPAPKQEVKPKPAPAPKLQPKPASTPKTATRTKPEAKPQPAPAPTPARKRSAAK